MIHASLTQDPSGRLIAYRAKGHAGYAEEGFDIVCSAVSILGVTCVNSLEALLHILAQVDNNSEGHLSFRLPPHLNEEQQKGAQLLMQSLYIGLQAIAEEYPKNLRVTIVNV